MVGGECGGDLYGEVEAVVEVVRSWDREIEQGRGYSPAKPKTVCRARGIDLALKWLAGSAVVICRVR
jgi:hypothetical protein